MKRVLKRWLAMMLAVLMVMGTLPTTAWAARRTEGEVSAEPVLEENDPTGKTAGRGDTEIPVIPVDPDPKPGEVLEIADNTVSIEANGSGSDYILKVKFQDNDAGANTYTVALLPRFRLSRANGTMPATYAENSPDTYLNSNADLATNWSAIINAGYPLVVLPHENSEAYTGKEFVWNWDGSMTLGGATMNTIGTQAGDFSKVTSAGLADWYVANTKNIYAENGDPIVGATSLPFTVFMMFGDNKAIVRPIEIPITLDPLTVKVVTKRVEINENPGLVTLTEVKVTNQSGMPMNNVIVTLARAMVVDIDNGDEPMSDALFGNEVIQIVDDQSDEERYEDSGDDDLYIKNYYGLQKTEGSAGTLSGKNCSILTIPELANGETYTLLIESKMPSGTEDWSYNEVDAWYNYTVWANYEPGTAGYYTKQAGDKDTGGIHSLPNQTVIPQVILYDPATGAAIEELSHRVTCAGVDFTYSEGVYTASGDVPMNRAIKVDDTTTIYRTPMSNDPVRIPMYTLTVETVRATDLAPVTKENGKFWEDSTKSAAENRINNKYYPDGAENVYVYTESKGIAEWSDNATEEFSQAWIHHSSQNGKYAGFIVEIDGNTTVTIKYLEPVRLITTFGGDRIDPTSASGNDRSITHVHKIEVVNKATNATITWTNAAPGTAIKPQVDAGLSQLAWELTLGAGDYDLKINGHKADEIHMSSLPTAGTVNGTTINYVVELVGVTPKIENATKEDIGGTIYPYMTLPDDANPDGDGTPVTVDPDTPTGRTLYYPKKLTNIPEVEIQDGQYNTLDKLEYPDNTAQTKPTGNDGEYKPTVAMLSGENDLIAIFAQKLELWIYVDGATMTNQVAAGDIKLVADAETVSVEQPDATNPYIFTSVTPLDASKTYKIVVNGIETAQTSATSRTSATVAGDDYTHQYIPVPLQKVTVGDQSGITTTQKSYFFGGTKYTEEKQKGNQGLADGYIPAGKQITVVHGDATGQSKDGWDITVKGTTTQDATNTPMSYTASATTAEGTSQGAKTFTAKYVSSTGSVKVKIYLDKKEDGTPKLSDTPVGTGENGVYLSKSSTSNTKAKELTRDSEGVYSADGVEGDKYFLWVNGEYVKETFTLASGDSKEDLEVQYWTITATAGPGAATATGSGIYLNDKTVQLNSSAATHYDDTDPTWAPKLDGSPNLSNTGIKNPTLRATATGSYEVTFPRKTAKIPVKLYLNGTNQYPTGYTAGTLVVTVKKSDGTLVDTWNSASATEFNHDFSVEQGYTYKVYLGTAGTGVGEELVKDYTAVLTGDQDAIEVHFYELTVKVGTTVQGNLDANAEVGQSLSTVSSTSNTASTVVYRAGKTVNIKAVSSNSANYTFNKWVVEKGTTPTTGATATVAPTAETILAAVFDKPYFDTYLQVSLNGTAQNSSTVGTGKDITAVPTITGAVGGVSWDTGKSAWKAKLATGSTAQWSVSTIGSKTFTVGNAGDDGTATLELFSIVATVKSGQSSYGTATPATKTIYKKGEAGSINASVTNSDWEFDTWTVTKPTSGVTTTSAATTASNSVTMNQETEVEASFKQRLGTVTVTVMLDTTTPVNDATVKLTVGGTDRTPDSTANGVYTFNNVPLNNNDTNGYKVTVSRTGYLGGDFHDNNVRLNSTTTAKNVNVNYYTLTLNVKPNNSAHYGAVAQSTATIADGDYGTKGQTKTAVYLSDTTVNIAARKEDNRFNFKGWENVVGGVPNPNSSPTTVTMSTTRELNATFGKDYYDTFLDVTVNGEAHTDSTGASKITSVKLFNKTTGVEITSPSVSYEAGSVNHWTARNVPDATVAEWRITTVDGAVYKQDAAKDGIATETLFGIVIEPGAGNDNTNKPTLQAPTTPTPTDYIVTEKGRDITVALNPINAGYTFKSPYLAGNAPNPTADITTGQASTATATKFVLADGYTAPADHADLYIKPQYTFKVNIRTLYSNTPTDPECAVVVLDAADDSQVKNWSSFDGSEELTGLNPDKTYKITVNGFDSGVTFGKGQANGNVDVTLRKISTKVVSKTGTTDTDPDNNAGTAYVKLNGAVGTGDTKTYVYLPNGAKTDGTHTVNLAAAAKTNYRAANSGTKATDSDLWTSATSGVIASGDKNTAGITLSITGTNGIQADIQVVAHFVRQWKVNVAKNPTNSSSDVYFDSKGTTQVTIDAGDGYTATFDRATGEMLNGWTYSTGGTLYAADSSGNSTSTTITSGQGGAYSKVYFVPSADNQTVTAQIGTKPYTVTVKVNLNNKPYENRKVVLKKGSTEYPMTETSTKGTFTVDVVPDNTGYEIWVNGLNEATTTAVAYTNKKMTFSADDGEKSINAAHTPGDAANLTKTINYYTIKIDRSFSDGVGNDNNIFANHDAPATKTKDSKIMLAGNTAAQSITATANNTPADTTLAGPYYKFTGWTVSQNTAATPGDAVNVANKAAAGNSTTFTLPAESALEIDDNIADNDGITITANYQRQYKVTVEKANTSDWGTITPKVNAAGSAAAVAGWPSYYYVNKGDSVDVKVSSTSGDMPDGWYFMEWRIKKAGTPASDVGAGKFNTDKDVGWLKPDNYKNVFKPDDDTALVLDLWKDATLGGGGWTYDRGTGDNTSASYGTLTWTANDAQEPKKITVFKSDGTQYKDPLVKDTDYSVTTTDGNVYTYTFKPVYLNAMPKDTYTVKFDYDLGDSTYDTCVEDLQKEQNFKIDISAYKLTEANIKVKDGSVTLNVDDTVNHGTAEHTSYEDKHIDPLETLTYKWFYSDTKPSQHPFTTQEVTDYNNGNPPSSWKWTALDDSNATTGFTDDATPNDDVYAVVPNYAGKGNNNLKGKYIFAVVTADTTGTGTVVTNSIPVDYDATITLRKDGDNSGNNIVHANYKVYLVPSNVTTPVFDGSNTKIVEAVHDDAYGKGVYKTPAKLLVEDPLNTKITYSVWVNDAETSDASNRHYVKVDGITISPPTNTSATVNYFSVNRKDFVPDSTTDDGGKEVKENFTDAEKKIASVTIPVTSTTVADGMGVLSGKTVTVKANGWNPDYKLNWKTQTGNNSDGTGLTNTSTINQTSGDASGTGYTTPAIGAKTWIGGDLKIQRHTIKGHIVGTGKITSAKLTVTVGTETYTFNATTIGNGQSGNNKVEFSVPNAPVDDGTFEGAYYTISAEVEDGTTLLGYSAPAKAAAESLTPKQLEKVDKDENGKFAIHIVSTSLRLKVADDDTHSTDTTGNTTASATHTWEDKFANNNGLVKKVTISNEGNAPLKVNWTLKKSILQADGSWSAYTPVTLDGNNQDSTVSGKKITFADMPAADLVLPVYDAANQTANKTTLTITVPNTLENGDDVKYQLEVKSVDGRAGQTGVGPTHTYNLELTINPVNVESVSTNKIKDANGNVIKYEVKTTTIAEDKNKTGTPSYDALVTLDDGDYDMTNNADIVYEWYVAPWDATVTLNKDTGVPEYVTGGTGPLDPGAGTRGANNATYEPTEDEKGMALFLVAKGQRNATSAAMTPDVDHNEPVELVPFDGIITITENTTPVTTEAGSQGYVVYLWNTAGGDNIDLNDTNGYLIPTVWDGTGTVKGFKSTKNLWASDPDNPDSTKPYTYKVYASIVKSEDPLKDTGKTISVGQRSANVTYYQVLVNETEVNQNTYEGKLNTADTSMFWTKDTLPDNLKKPSAAAAGVASTVNVEGNWVQTGTSVTFTYPDWTKDYKLTWDGPVSGSAYAGAASTKTLTYGQYRAEVDTTLELNLYDVTANVIGGGVLSEITMTMGAGDTLNEFTMSGADDLPNHKIKATTHTGNIAGGNSVVFKVPAGTMVMEGTKATESTTILGYKVPHDDATLIDDGTQKITVTRADTDMRSYDIMLQGSGQSLNVTDTHGAPQHSTTATYDGTTGYPGSTTHTITLNYNYDSAVTLPIKVTNTSTALDETGGQHIYNVTANYNSVAGEKKGDGTNLITLTDWTTIPDMAAGDAAAVALTYTVPKGLPVGTYNYTAVFGFDNDDTGNNTVATATFKLTVEVKPLTFTAVEAEEDTSALVKTYKIKDYNVKPDGAAEITDVVPGSTGTTGEDTRTGLAHGDDYAYQWVTTAAGVNTADVTWNSTNGTLTLGASTQKGAATDNTSATYVPDTGDQGRNLYLVIYSNKAHGTGNATGMAVYGPIKQGFQGVVYIKEDAKEKRGETDANGSDGTKGGGYTVNFVNGGNKYPATWTEVSTGVWGYANSTLEADKTYTVEVSRFKNDTANPVVLTGATISNANRDTEAPYYTVNPVAFKPFHYHDGITNEKFDDAITPDIYLGTAEVNGTPVLSGQSVTAKANAWTQDYTLTWAKKSGDNNATSADYDDLTDTSVKQDSATAVATGLSGTNSITVTSKTFVGGRLDQNTYVVKGKVENETGMSGGNTDQVEMAYVPAEANDPHAVTAFTFTTKNQDTTGATKYLNKDNTTNTITDRNNAAYGTITNGVAGEPGDEISITVVKGKYMITAYDGTRTTVQRVTVGGDGDSVLTGEVNLDAARDKEQLDRNNGVAEAGRIFTVYVADAELTLTVAHTQTPVVSATSTVAGAQGVTGADNHHFDDNEQEYYFNTITADNGTFNLTLKNGGNTDLKLKAPEVYSLDPDTPHEDASTAGRFITTLLTGTNKLTVSGNACSVTDVFDLTALPSAGKLLTKGTAAEAAGVLKVNVNAADKADKIYVIKFASEATNNKGVTSDGPTVYYVLDLTVKPLPIEEVKVKSNKGILQLETLDTAAGVSGLDSVRVDHDGKSSTPRTGAEEAGLDDTNDISFLWFSAPASMPEADVKAAIEWNAAKDGIVSTDARVTPGVNANTGKTYSPSEAEQGLNFYLVAFRKGGPSNVNSNADGFAVSDALYAQVTIGLKAYRTGETTETNVLTDVQIHGTLGDDKANSNTDNGFTVTDKDNSTIAFTADKNDYMKKNPTATSDDPSQAAWYFHHWAVKLQDNTEIGATDDSVTTPVDGERLDMNYAVSGKATVIGYYDLLPTLRDYDDQNTDLGFNSTPSKDDPNARTMTYTVNDGTGEGRVRIVITPPDDKAFKTTATTAREIVLGWNEFDSVAGDADPNTRGDKIGRSGKYVLNRQFIVDTLELGVEYSITFYDLDKGSKKAGGDGYEGYDRTVTIVVTGGEVNVKAQAEDIDKEQEGRQTNGKVRITSGATVDKTKDPVLEGTAETVGSRVAIQAIPDAGYKFAGWKNASEDPTAIGTFGNASAEETTFRALVEGCIAEASFVAAEFDVTPGSAKVYYGNTKFEDQDDAGNDLLFQINSSSGTPSVDYEYKLLTEEELTDYLTKKGMTRADNYFTTDGKTVDGTTTNKIPEWLDWNEVTDADGKKQLEFSVKAGYEAKGVNVKKDATDELVVFVKVTTQAAGAEKIVPFTIDIMTTKLKIVTNITDNSRDQDSTEEAAEGTAYKDKYLAKYASDGTDPEGTKVDGAMADGMIIHGNDVEMDLFEFLHVVSIHNGNDKVIDDATAGSVNTPVAVVTNVGKWTIVPPTFDGSGPDDENYNTDGYTFTFKYTGLEGPEDDLNYEGDEITMRLPVQKPSRALLIGDTVTNADAVVPGTLTNDATSDYSPVEKPAGYTSPSDDAPEAMAYTTNTFRKNETITYLDEEPEYTVSFKRIGDVRNITLTLDEEDQAVVGFVKPTQAAMDAVVEALKQAGDEKTGELSLKLAAVDTTNNVWVGKHYIRFKLSGEDQYGPIDPAYYTLELHIEPKVITSIDVKTDGGKVDVTGTTTGKDADGNPVPVTVNDDDRDGKENYPIKPGTTVEETKGPDGKVIERKTTVEIDPNYIYVKTDDPENEPDNEITNKTTLDDKDKTDPNLDVTRDEEKPDHIVHITQNIPWLMFHDKQDSTGTTGTPKQKYANSASQRAGENTLGTYTIYLGGYGADVYDVEIVDITGEDGTAETSQLWPNGVKLIKVEDDTELAYGADLTDGNPDTIASLTKDTPVARYILDLSGLPTQSGGRFTIKLQATGTTETGNDDRTVPEAATYTFTVTISNPSSPPPPPPACPCKVLYHVGAYGTTVDTTIEDVKEGTYPSKVPAVTALDGYIFLGWSLTDPATVKDGKIPEVVDPKTVDPWKNNAKGEDVVFYAVIMERPYHEHYVIGYPNGNFGPADDINRASVATIIARAILPGFVEGANYGNPGGYSDVSGHWAESAIAYCSKYNVFKGYDDGTFRPDQPITRQEFALVIARLDGVMTPGEMPFDDIEDAGSWAWGGIYTAYVKGWVNGYPDGTFKPLNNIRRDEAVKVFNAYLGRGVDADGLHKLHEYVHSGVASNNTENGTDEYMTWPDVPKDHWAYYEIVEAANDHEYAVDFGAEPNYTVPETWDKCWINERWRYHDDISDGGPNAAMVSAGFRVWLH